MQITICILFNNTFFFKLSHDFSIIFYNSNQQMAFKQKLIDYIIDMTLFVIGTISSFVQAKY